MTDHGTTPNGPRKHLHTKERIARAMAAGGEVDLTRRHGQGNGLRVHSIYFAVVSVVVLAVLIAAVILAGRMM